MQSDNFKKNISLGALNNGKKRIRPADIDNNKENIRLADINQQRSKKPNLRPWNRLLSELSSTFREVTFSESKFQASTMVWNTQYKHYRSQNKNPFYPFHD